VTTIKDLWVVFDLYCKEHFDDQMAATSNYTVSGVARTCQIMSSEMCMNGQHFLLQ